MYIFRSETDPVTRSYLQLMLSPHRVFEVYFKKPVSRLAFYFFSFLLKTLCLMYQIE